MADPARREVLSVRPHAINNPIWWQRDTDRGGPTTLRVIQPDDHLRRLLTMIQQHCIAQDHIGPLQPPLEPAADERMLALVAVHRSRLSVEHLSDCAG